MIVNTSSSIVNHIAIILTMVFIYSAGYGQSNQDRPITILGDSSLTTSSKVIITGKITDANSLPIYNASISVDTHKYFDYSDKDGRFFIELPAGTYNIMVRYVSKEPISQRIRVFSTDVINFMLVDQVLNLDEVVISSRPIDSNVKSTLSGVSQFKIAEIKTLPSFMGEVDILKTIQLLPGVTSVGEGSSGINVRGGRVDQNLILLNGTPIFSATHALGFIPAFNQDVVQGFTLYKGNVPAYLGGRASSVLDIRTRAGNFDTWEYQGGIGLASSRFLAEGPIVAGKTSILFGGRISYADWLLKTVKNPDVNKSSLFFYDLNGTVAHRFTENSKLQLNYYASYDFFRFSDQFAFDWTNQTLNAEWNSLTNRKVSPTTTIAIGNFKNSLIDPEGFDASELINQMKYTQIKESVNYLISENHELVGGLEMILYDANPEKSGPYGGNNNIKPEQVDKNRGLEAALFISDEFKLNENFSFSLGARYSAFRHLGSDTVFTYQNNQPRSVQSIQDTLIYKNNETIGKFGGLEPRVSVRLGINAQQSFKLSYNRMRQYINLISNTTAPTPVDLWQISTGYLPPQVADNYSIGYFLNQKNNIWEMSVEGFYKQVDNLIEYKDFASLYLNRHLETELLSAEGKAYGLEFYMRKLKGRWNGWISYTYSRTFVRTISEFPQEQINRGEWYPANFDRPHNANVVINRTMRKKGNSWSMLVNYSSGRPITAIESSYLIDGVVVPLYSDRNQYRIPDYFRIDLSLTLGDVFKKIDDSLTFSIYNLLGRDNAYSVYYTRPANNFVIPKPYQLAILGATFPSIVYNFKF